MNEPCPYCTSENLIKEVLFTPKSPEKNKAAYLRFGSYMREAPALGQPSVSFGKGEIRGDYWILTYTEEALAERLAGFKVVLIGKGTETRFDWPPGPFFQTIIQPRPGIYFAFRMTHKDAPGLAIDVHYWPSHGRIVTVRGVADGGMSTAELRIVNEAMKLLRKESRGAQKIDKVALIKAIQKQGPDATQKQVAKALRVSPQALQAWATNNGLNKWEDVKLRYANTEIW